MEQLKLNLLGTFAATRSGSPIHTFRSNTERTLLAYLAVEAGQAHLRDALAAMFWPESAEITARRNFRVTLSRLRKAIGDTESPQPALLVTPQTLQCNPQAAIWSDVTAFNTALDACDTHPHDHEETCETCYQQLKQAAALYQGDFLAGLSIPDSLSFEEWAWVQREALHRRALQSFDTLARASERRGDYADMERFAQRQLTQEPWREGAQRQLMRALALTGQRGAALKQYEICRQIMQAEFGVEPADETNTLHEEIRAGTLGWEAAPDTPEPENPYKGLRAFGEEDAADFFGRRALVERLLARLTPSPESGEDQGDGRFLSIVGPSGSGKSSLVCAGLIPALRRGALPGSEQWHIVQMLPGAQPFKALYAAIAIELNLVENHIERQQMLQEGDLGLLQMVKTMLPADKNVKLLLVIDQFEELFTLTADEAERERFLRNLLAAVNAPQNRLHIIITLRADFYGRPMMYADFGALIRRGDEVLLPLKAEDLEQAITGPAARLGVHFEPGLAAVIAADVSAQPGTLPLLQYALTELFDRRENRTLTKSAYQASGGVSGALIRRAETVYAELDELGQFAARQIFLRLITLGEGTEDVRRRVSRSELEALSITNDQYSVINDQSLISYVLDSFGVARLLTFDRNPLTQAPTVEVAHEALLRVWERLREWIHASRGEIRLHRRLTAATAEWERRERESDFLESGARLAQYEAWAAVTNLARTQPEDEFLQASLAKREEHHAMADARQARETALEDRARNWQVRLNVVLSVAVVIALALTIFAFDQWRNAQREADISNSLSLATSSQLALNEKNTNLALALALEANRIDNPPAQAQLMLADAAYAPGTRLLFLGHEGAVQDVAITPNGRLALSASVDQTLILWDLITGKQVRRLEGHTGSVNGVAISQDGETAVSGSADNSLILWDLATGAIIHRFNGHEDVVQDVAISPDGKSALSSASDNSLILWDMNSGEILHRFIGHEDTVLSVAISPNGKTALSGSADRSVIYWDLSNGEIIHHFIGQTDTLEAILTAQGHINSVWGVAFSPDGQQAISAAQDTRTIVWDLTTGTQISLSSSPTIGVTGMAVSPDGRTVLLGLLDAQVALLNLTKGESTQRLLGHTGRVQALAFTPDGRQAISGAADGTLRLWDLQSGAEVRQLYDTWSGSGVDISPDEKIGLTGLWDNAISLWDYETGEHLRYLRGHTEMLMAGAYFTPDSKMVVSGSGDVYGVSEDNTVRVWDVATGEEIQRFEGHTDKLWTVAVGPNNHYAASGSHDGTLRLWNIQTGAGQILHDVTPQAVRSAVFNPDGNSILIGLAKGNSDAPDYRLRQIDISATGKEIRYFEGHQDVVSDVTFSPDGRLALSGSNDAVIILWDVATGQSIHRLTGHTTSVTSVAFSPNGRLAASSDIGGGVILWDAVAGTLLRHYVGHVGYALEVVFTPDGETLLSVADDDTVREWQVDASQEVLLDWIAANRHVPAFTCEQRTRYRVEPLCE